MKKFFLLIGLLLTLTGCYTDPPGCDSRIENCGRPSDGMKQEISSELNDML